MANPVDWDFMHLMDNVHWARYIADEEYEMSDINPKHYEIFLGGQIHQVADLMEARFATDVHLGQALKYLLRAGRKKDASYISDVGKCIWWCAKSIMYHGGKFVELPQGCPSKTEVQKPKPKPRRKAK